MKASGIVVEYNPFHNGHKFHLEQVKKLNPDNIVIAVMSGDFVQRGEPSLVDKWKKTEMALKNGIDIVVELPAFYSTQSAEIFAKGAIGILNELGCENVVFGSESADLLELIKIATFQENENFKKRLRELLKSGNSYPTAHNLSMQEILKGKRLSSNDILGLEYIKAIKYWKSDIKPIAIKRENVGYYDTEVVKKFASATKIRELIKNRESIEEIVPNESFKILNKCKKIVQMSDFFPFIKYELIKNYQNLRDIQDMEIGFYNKLYENVIKYDNYQDFFDSIINKRYTLSRIQRVLIHTLLNITGDITKSVKDSVPYVKILGFNEMGKIYLSKMRKNKKIITTYKKMNEIFSIDVCSLIEFNEKCSKIYRLVNNYDDYKIPIIFKGEE